MNVLKTKKRQMGWREWVSLPELGVKKIKVKVDTGARTASLHAYDVSIYRRHKKEFVKFRVNPTQGHARGKILCKAEVIEYRDVRSSNGKKENRPVIETEIQWQKRIWKIEITLANRDEMGFRMLLGRKSIPKGFVVDPNKSYFGKKRKKKNI